MSFIEGPELDEVCLSRVVQFVNCPAARLCCRSWSEYIFTSLQLDFCLRLHKAVRAAEKGSFLFFHSTLFDFGGIEECVSFSFAFFAKGHYTLQWFREGLTSDNEQQYGLWKVIGDKVQVETCDPPEKTDERYLRYAEAGRIYQIPVEHVLLGNSSVNQSQLGWERTARGLTSPHYSVEATEESPPAASPVLQPLQSMALQQPAADARFVEVDGEMHEVSQDIISNWPESDWSRLMSCRLRFGAM